MTKAIRCECGHLKGSHKGRVEIKAFASLKTKRPCLVSECECKDYKHK